MKGRVRDCLGKALEGEGIDICYVPYIHGTLAWAHLKCWQIMTSNSSGYSQSSSLTPTIPYFLLSACR